MPSKNNPKSVIKIGEGSSICQDGSKGNLSTQVLIAQDAYDAEQISAENPFETYLGDEVQSHLDDLASQVKIKPPYIGEGSKTFTQGTKTSTISGVPDWGVLKQVDNSAWDRNTLIEFEGESLKSTYFRNSNLSVLPYAYEKPSPFGIDGSDPRTDVIFNSVDNDLLGSGDGASFLASAREQVGEPFRHCRSVYTQATGTTSDGFTISGFLFPADRGTIALLHWKTGVPNFSYNTATSITDISERVISAINLGEGRLNKDTSPPVFIEGTDQYVFPSKLTGQFDLREMQSGVMRSDLADNGDPVVISEYTADQNLGSVRLLKEAGACFFGVGVATVDPKGNIPVLFGAYSYDTVTSDWVENTTNFLAYRMPALEDYLPSGLKTPNVHRERFFQVIQPASTTSDFETAGNYVTFGDDYYTYQVARYRHVVKYSDLGLNSEAKGSFALVHFKKEDTFERLVRDGISPSEDDLYSVKFINLLEGEHIDNLVVSGESYTEYGIPVLAPKNQDATSNTLLKPNVFVRNRNVSESVKGISTKTHTTHKNEVGSGDSLRFKPQEGYFTTISGVKYLLPTRDKSTKSSDVVFLSESYNKILNKVSLSGDVHLLDLSKPRYFTQNTSVSKKYSEPFDPFLLNFSAYSSDSNLLVEEPNVKEIPSEKQIVSLGWDDIKADPDNYNPTVAGTYFDVNVIPQGDTGIPTFSTGGNISFMFKSPLYHHDGLGFSETIKPVYTDNDLNDGHRSKNLLYHSARLVSLIENATTSKVYLHFAYTALARNNDQAFAIFRYDPEGFRVYQTLNLETNSNIELCSEENKVGGGTFPSYPIYRPTQSNLVVQNTSVADANVFLVEGEEYFVEAQPNFNTVGEFKYAIQGTTTVSGNYMIDVNTKFGLDTYENSNAFDNRSAGYGISLISVNNSGVATQTNVVPLAQRNLMHKGSDLHEVAKGLVNSVPSYGNFTQNERGIISVLSYGKTPPNSTMLVFNNPVSPLTSLFTSRKDTQERFLDESYRINVHFSGVTDASNLEGPGLPLGSRANTLKVRDDDFVQESHGQAGYLRNSLHWIPSSFSNTTVFTDGNGDDYYKDGEAQVRGISSLSDMVLNGGEYGHPRRGNLVFPQIDYTTKDYFPNFNYDAQWDLQINDHTEYFFQPDYSDVLEGGPQESLGNRLFSYSRIFDVEFSRSGTVENMKGTSRFKLRVLGLSFSDFSHSVSDRGVVISVKIPGLTTWLDIGRPNNQGVSKQHISKDGAGCLISYQEGFTVKESIYCTDLVLEMGSLATFIKNSEGECPVLIKVSFERNTKGLSLTFGDGNTRTPLVQRKGLVGLEILRISNGMNIDGDSVVY